MKKPLSLLLFVVLAWPSLVFGELSTAAESMRGMEEVMVSVYVEFEDYVDLLNPSNIADNFNISFHRWMVEQRLSNLGVNVVEELSPDPHMELFQGNLVLAITPIVFAKEDFIVYYTLKLIQSVDISRDSSPSLGTTWERTLLSRGRDEAQPFDDNINDLVDLFVDDYFKANPEPRSGQGDE